MPETPRPARETSKRTRIACKLCHRRRVKCDAGEARPCWHCRLRGLDCELIESRRGKYLRKKPSGAGASSAAQRAARPIKPKPGAPAAEAARESPVPLAQSPSIPSCSSSAIGDSTRERQNGSDGPEMLFSRLAESGSDVESPGLWTENVRSYYMGDSFSLAFVVRSLSVPSAPQAGLKLHYPVPDNIAEHAHNSAEGLKESDPATIAYLNMHGAFTLPPQEVSEEFVHLFFECVHPAYPVFDRQEFCALYQQKRVSLLVLQTIYFLSSIICSEQTLKRAGFVDRYSARRTFYLRAKALYDMDCEKSKEKLTAVLFLLGFWWEGPEDQKDTWYWLGAATSLAQSLGMHRSTANAGMSFRQRAIWKRIWWSIYIRDRHAAAALGRPCRINDEDCDVEMLDTEDFLIDQVSEDKLVCVEHPYHRAYVIEMAKLAVILGKLLRREFAPRNAKTDNASSGDLNISLDEWATNLPPQLCREPVDATLGAHFWSCMLDASYYNCQILLFRPNGSRSVSEQATSFQSKARVAADSTTRIVEDLLTAGTMSRGQLHLVPAIFAALSIHVLVIRSSDLVQKQLAENRARQCILGMSELAKGWPVAGWILRLFKNLMQRLTGQTGTYEIGPARPFEGVANSDLLFDQQSAQPALTAGDPVGHGDHYAMSSDGPMCQDSRDSFGLIEADQLMADIIWAPDQNDLQFDLMLNGAFTNTLFSSNPG